MARMRDAAAAGLVLAAAVLAGALLSTPLSHAAGEPEFGCKKIHRGKADIDPNPKGRAPVALGDSTMILPIPNLNDVGYSVNARGCRGFKEAINIVAKLKAKHHLPHLVLINSYGNGGVNPRLIAEALAVLGKKRVLGLITAYDADTGKPPAPDTDVLYKSARRYPHRDLRPRLGQVQPVPPRSGPQARRLVPPRSLPPQLHRRRRVSRSSSLRRCRSPGTGSFP